MKHQIQYTIYNANNLRTDNIKINNISNTRRSNNPRWGKSAFQDVSRRIDHGQKEKR